MDDQDDDRQVEHRGAWMTKLVMRCLSAVSAIVLVALTAALTDKWRVRQSYYYSTPPVLVLAPQAGIALAWAVLDVLVMLFMRWRSRPGSPPSSSSRPRRPRRPGTRSDGVHPGLAVTLDLLLWLGFIAGTILFSFMHYVSDPYYSDDYYSFNRDDYDQLSWVHDVGSAVLAFCCLSVVLHFTLFVFASIQVSRRNRNAPIVYYTPPPMPMYPMYGYHQQPYPQHQQPYQPQPPQMQQHYPQQPVFIPAGQAPPPGWIPVSFGPPQQQQQGQQGQQMVQTQNPSQTSSPLPREPSPVHTADPGPSGTARADPGPSGTAHET